MFFKTGYYSKQPGFEDIYINFDNNLNPNLTNEKVVGFELGYGLRTEKLNVNANLNRIFWSGFFMF